MSSNKCVQTSRKIYCYKKKTSKSQTSLQKTITVLEKQVKSTNFIIKGLTITRNSKLKLETEMIEFANIKLMVSMSYVFLATV